MTNDQVCTVAVVGSLSSSFDSCIKPHGSADPIDMPLARRQHTAYVSELEKRVDKLIRVGGDVRYPDGCFVEDPVVCVGEFAIMCNMAAQSRRGEGDAIEAALSDRKEVRRLVPPATLDGGDVLIVGERIFVGMTARSNMAAVEQLTAIAKTAGVKIVPVEVDGVLHLKSACSWIGEQSILIASRYVDAGVFDGLELVHVPKGEEYAANALHVNGAVFVSAGYEGTIELVKAMGKEVVPMHMSEFRKAGGSLTCLSVLLP